MKDINGIPVYQATVDEEGTGMVVVSLVDAPAIESGFMAFAKQVEPMRFSVQDEDKHLVFGPVMVPDLPIYRETMDGMPYYIVYKAETIHKMAERYFAENRINDVDHDHNFELVEGVTLVEAFFKDTEKGINPVGYEDLPNDTLFFKYHVNNQELWDTIKAGTWKGFSLAGNFGIEPVMMEKQSEPEKDNVVEDINSLLEQIINKLR